MTTATATNMTGGYCSCESNSALNYMWDSDNIFTKQHSGDILTDQLNGTGSITWNNTVTTNYTDIETLNKLIKTLNEEKNKGDTDMATCNSNISTGYTNPKTNAFNFDFGPLENNSNVRMSPYGLAVCNNTGSWVAYDKVNDCIVDTDFFNFPNGNKYMYKIPSPLSAIRVGDIILHNRKPMFVSEIKKEESRLLAIDIQAGEEKVIMPARSPFGFNFVTKIVSMFDMCGFGMNAGASEENPFGNLLPMLMFMGDNKDFDPIMLMFMINGQNPFAQMFNPPHCDNK